jgi:hypothetical protein
MPMGQDLLPDEQIATLRNWVAGGALDDTPKELVDPSAATEPPTYTQAPVINALAFSPDGKTLAVAGYREVLLHKVGGGL